MLPASRITFTMVLAAVSGLIIHMFIGVAPFFSWVLLVLLSLTRGVVMAGEFFVVRRGATAVPNATVWNKKLSIQALGVLALLLSMPPGAPMGYRALLGRGMGRDLLLRCFRELEESGYRWRFYDRQGSGRLVTVVGVFDVPVCEVEAREALELARGGALGAVCSAGSGESKQETGPSSEQEGEPDSIEHVGDGAVGESHDCKGVTVRRISGARCEQGDCDSTVRRVTGARSAVARSAGALSLRDTKLLDKSNNLTEPDLGESDSKRCGDEGCGAVGSGRAVSVDGSSGSSGVSVSGGESVPPGAGLLAQCLPPGMQALDPSGAARVVGLLRERLDAGWRPREIRSLMDQPVPGDVGRLSALVAYRLEHNVAPLMAPARLQRVALDAEASRRRRAVEALERDAGADVDPVWSRVWDEVTAECVGVSRVVQVREAQKRYDRLVGDQA